MFIVGIKKGNDLHIVTKKSTRKAVYTLKVPYPEDGFIENKKAWYDIYKNHIKPYKTQGSAKRMGENIVSHFAPTDGYKVIELTDEITSDMFDGCPNCGSFEVIETFSTYYTRPLKFDKSDMSIKQLDSAEASGGGEIISYECSQCGKDLSGFDFSQFINDKSNKEDWL